VTFSGVVSGSANTDASGNFSLTTTAQALGTFQATTRDLWELSSDTVTVLRSNAPVITDFQASRDTTGSCKFTGKVTDESGTATMVVLGGLPSLDSGPTKVTIGAGGTFEVTVLLQPGETGTATVQTTDGWGQSSNVATTLVP
jgi:hypothetical protein